MCDTPMSEASIDFIDEEKLTDVATIRTAASVRNVMNPTAEENEKIRNFMSIYRQKLVEAHARKGVDATGKDHASYNASRLAMQQSLQNALRSSTGEFDGVKDDITFNAAKRQLSSGKVMDSAMLDAAMEAKHSIDDFDNMRLTDNDSADIRNHSTLCTERKTAAQMQPARADDDDHSRTVQSRRARMAQQRPTTLRNQTVSTNTGRELNIPHDVAKRATNTIGAVGKADGKPWSGLRSSIQNIFGQKAETKQATAHRNTIGEDKPATASFAHVQRPRLVSSFSSPAFGHESVVGMRSGNDKAVPTAPSLVDLELATQDAKSADLSGLEGVYNQLLQENRILRAKVLASRKASSTYASNTVESYPITLRETNTRQGLAAHSAGAATTQRRRVTSPKSTNIEKASGAAAPTRNTDALATGGVSSLNRKPLQVFSVLQKRDQELSTEKVHEHTASWAAQQSANLSRQTEGKRSGGQAQIYAPLPIKKNVDAPKVLRGGSPGVAKDIPAANLDDALFSITSNNPMSRIYHRKKNNRKVSTDLSKGR